MMMSYLLFLGQYSLPLCLLHHQLMILSHVSLGICCHHMGTPPPTHMQPTAFFPRHTFSFSLLSGESDPPSIQGQLLHSRSSALLLLSQKSVTSILCSTIDFFLPLLYHSPQAMYGIMSWALPLPPIVQQPMLDKTGPYLQLRVINNSGNVHPLHTAIDLGSSSKPAPSHVVHELPSDIVIDLCLSIQSKSWDLCFPLSLVNVL